MSKMSINIGNSANDGNGEPARSAFNKTNKNFDEIYSYIGDGTNLNKLGTAAFKSVGRGPNELPGPADVFYAYSARIVENYVSSGSFDFFNVPVGIKNLIDAGVNKVNAPSGNVLLAFTESVYDTANYVTKVLNYQTGEQSLSLYTQGIRKGWRKLLDSGNTTQDSNGFIKAASPVAKLFADKIEPNNEAAEQNITFEKIDVGHYLIKGSSGFAQEGWYIETPKDANGNILFAVNYEQLENGDIEVKTYKKKFDLESASIVADLENPMDIMQDRWIDIRLQEVPKTVPEMPNEEVNSDEPQQ